jgi:hypothetical protein
MEVSIVAVEHMVCNTATHPKHDHEAVKWLDCEGWLLAAQISKQENTKEVGPDVHRLVVPLKQGNHAVDVVQVLTVA